jgi:membrane fusion protein, multidrug efflux system
MNFECCAWEWTPFERDASAKRSSSIYKRSLFLTLIAVLTICSAIFSVGCRESNSAGATARSDKYPPPGKRVKFVKASSGILARTIAVSGTLAAEENVTLSLKVSGRVRDIYVDLGSNVQKGQALVRLEPTDFDLRVSQAEAALQQARVRLGLPLEGDVDTVEALDTGVVRQAAATREQARLTQERMKSLWDQGLIPKSQMDDAVAGYQVADARYQDSLEEVRNRQALLYQRRTELEIAKKQLSDSVLTAPMDGAISGRLISPGQFLPAGEAAIVLVRVDPLRLKLAVPEREAASIRQNQQVNVRVEGDENVYSGRVARLSPAIATDNRTLMVEAEIGNAKNQLRPGSFARAEIVIQSQDKTLLVPASSIVTFAGLDKVISLDKQGHTLEKRVTVGRRAGEQVEIVEGLAAGDPVALQPGNLVGGEAVQATW